MMRSINLLYMRILHMIGRGRTTLVNDAGNVQTMQLELGQDEVRDNTPRMAEYGFTSSPPAGSDAVLVFIGGDRLNAVVVGTNHQPSRMKGLSSGEVAIYDNLGQSIYLSKTGITINSAGLPITINGNIILNGSLTATGDVVANGVSVKHHIHSGVEPGGSNTGNPV